MSPDTDALLEGYLMYFILPLWLAAGLADYALHRQTNISETSGIKESLIHALMIAEVGAAVLIGLFLEINALTILVILGLFVVHEATGFWDLAYAHESDREVTPIEQHVHSFLEMIPLMATSIIILLNWDQFLSLFGMGTQAPSFSVALKSPPLPAGYLVGILIAVTLFALLPFAEELWRCTRHRSSRVR